MKIRHIIPAFLILACSALFSCDAVKSLADVNIDTTASMLFVVSETAVNTGGKTYSSTQLLDLTTNSDVEQYASKIKSFTVNKVTYSISPGANPNTVLFTNGTLTIVSSGTTVASASSVSLTTTSETQLTTNTAGFTELATKLLADRQEQIQLQGTLSSTPVAFTFVVHFYFTIHANAL